MGQSAEAWLLKQQEMRGKNSLCILRVCHTRPRVTPALRVWDPLTLLAHLVLSATSWTPLKDPRILLPLFTLEQTVWSRSQYAHNKVGEKIDHNLEQVPFITSCPGLSQACDVSVDTVTPRSCHGTAQTDTTLNPQRWEDFNFSCSMWTWKQSHCFYLVCNSTKK